MAQESMIRVEQLTKSYGPKRAVDQLTFQVPRGEVLGFLGPNGAGKSTTMKILTCYLAPTSGIAEVGGMDVRTDSLKVRQRLGYLPEDTPLYQDLTTLEFLEFAARLRQVDPAQRTRRIREIARVCGLFEVMGQPVGELSKGYRQRVGLAQAMVHDPPILILDEPTSGLDPNQIVEIRELIKEIGEEKTVVLSTHILSEVEATCGRVIIIHEGRMVADGTTAELTERLRINRYRLVVDPAPGRETESDDERENGSRTHLVVEKLRSMDGVESVTPVTVTADDEHGDVEVIVSFEGETDRRRDLFAFAEQVGWTLLELSRRAATLEDVFRELTLGEQEAERRERQRQERSEDHDG
jgi:ABC-2 type transport system ATP-binding protein